MAEALLKAGTRRRWSADVGNRCRAEGAGPPAQHAASPTWALPSKGLSWTQTDDALPMPVDMRDALVALAVRSSDFIEALNQQPLKVRGLAAGRYTLKIDGETAGSVYRGATGGRASIWRSCPRRWRGRRREVHALTLRHNNAPHDALAAGAGADGEEHTAQC